MSIKINTAAVVNSAHRIASHNNAIDNNFNSVIQAVQSLDRAWDSGVSDMAINSFNNLKRTYPTNRYRVIDDMKNFMIKSVSDGYENAETAISSAAKAFK